MNLLAALFGVFSGLMTLSGLVLIFAGWQESDGTPPDITTHTSCTRVSDTLEQCEERGNTVAWTVADASEAESTTLAGAALTVSGGLLGLGYAVVASAQWRHSARQYGGVPGPG